MDPADDETHDDVMTGIRPATDAEQAQWLLDAGVDWHVLIRYGPPGFEVYARVALITDQFEDAEESSLRAVLATLVSHTTTPADGYAAIWEGIVGTREAPQAPRVPIPNREMLLFTGPIDELRDTVAVAWYGQGGGHAEPHLVWPADRAWCVACDVDEEIEFSVGCSAETAQALITAFPGTVRRVRYGEPAQLFRDVPLP